MNNHRITEVLTMLAENCESAAHDELENNKVTDGEIAFLVKEGYMALDINATATVQ